ncbi:replication initiator protein [Sigmofec virus UA08Rod_4774]|uniref:Replication initiator protein n=1 Tax=Sigmofec virus UA08Rod_4774 TaxID=2929409 RepID=A0A976N120_9VIRU|nr:replication initiator protein [Sigmofec virus UA08Rod_4774]
MCLYPRLIRNPRYIQNKKNGGYVPTPTDNRARFVAIGCGECIECRKKKSRDWRIRLLEEFKTNNQCSFITLTFDNDSLLKYRLLAEEELNPLGLNKYCDIYETDNIAAKIAIRHMLERHRKKTGKSIKHWLITERGHKNTRRIHIHGIIWYKFEQRGRGNSINHDLTKLWANGWAYNGDYVGEATISYISKYITKNDVDNKHYTGKIMSSPGIGKAYILKGGKRNVYNKDKTCETYKLPNGQEIGLPMYYRNHIYNENQREKLWMALLDKKTRYVLGTKVDVSESEDIYSNLRDQGRLISKNAGYEEPEWANNQYQKKYFENCKMISNFAKLIEKKQDYENCKIRSTDHRQLCAKNTELCRGGNNANTGSNGGWEEIYGTNRCRHGNDNHKRVRGVYGKNTYIPADRIKTATMHNLITIGKHYEIIDIETGEIYTSEQIKSKTLKTISYEKHKQFERRPDGTKRTIWRTKRFVKEVGANQLELKFN